MSSHFHVNVNVTLYIIVEQSLNILQQTGNQNFGEWIKAVPLFRSEHQVVGENAFTSKWVNDFMVAILDAVFRNICDKYFYIHRSKSFERIYGKRYQSCRSV